MSEDRSYEVGYGNGISFATEADGDDDDRTAWGPT